MAFTSVGKGVGILRDARMRVRGTVSPCMACSMAWVCCSCNPSGMADKNRSASRRNASRSFSMELWP